MDTLVTRKTNSSVSLVVVNAKSFETWKRKQSKGVRAWVKAHGFKPKGGQVLAIAGPDGFRQALFAPGAQGLWDWSRAASHLPAGRYVLANELPAAQATEAAVGWALASYRFDRYRSEAGKEPAAQLVWPANADQAESRRLVAAISHVRDLVNTPAEDLGPEELSEEIRALGEQYGAKVRVVRGKKLEEGYPAIAAVGRGSRRRPRLVDLRWGKKDAPKLTLVGKGVCFDSGGLNLKSAAGMIRMKKDMGGSAVVIGLARLIMDAELPVSLRVLVPTVENMPFADAYRPSDVIQTRKGKTIEITNTDAEGRLILSDALAEGDAEKPDLMIDLATLTGNARSALGPHIVPFFTTDDDVAASLALAAQRTKDLCWRMPLHAGYRRYLDSKIADIRNTGTTAMAGAITAALFLKEFVDEAEAWLHCDIYAWNESAKPGRTAGGAATGLRALWAMLCARYGVDDASSASE